MTTQARPPSLISRLFIAQIAPLSLASVVLLMTGFWTADRVVERTADRLLAGAMQTILDTVSLEDGAVTVNVTPHSLALLDTPERDAVFYSVREGAHRLVTGYDDLPISEVVSIHEPHFANLEVRGLKVRMAQQAIQIPGKAEPVYVSVAQSLDSRQASLRELQFSLLLLPGLLVVLAAFLVWPAIRWGLHSLNRLTQDLSSRTRGGMDFTPVPTALAPRELTSALAAFNALLAHLERSATGIQRFAADASHQLRTPLSVVAANLDLLRQSSSPRPTGEQRLLEDSQQAVASMSRLIQQLLSVARADSVQAPGQADLRRAVRRAVETRTLGSISQIKVRQPDHDVLVQGDESLITEQVANLLDNAQRYGAAPIYILITSSPDGGSVTLWDHGQGVADEDLPRLLERFYRGKRADLMAGSGLGLSIVSALAEAQGGQFEIRNCTARAGLVARLGFTLGQP